MAKERIPDEVRAQVDAIVEQFNQEEMPNPRSYYIARFRGGYLYLDRNEWGRIVHICRLEYNGAMDNWDFAIFRYSREFYDPDEWMFPGAGHVDGTVEGAMRAGLKAYPV
jgi:putative hemolysin